jgi:hypothetical protein
VCFRLAKPGKCPESLPASSADPLTSPVRPSPVAMTGFR